MEPRRRMSLKSEIPRNIRKAEEEDVKGVEANGKSFERSRIFGVVLVEADEVVETGSEGTLPDGIVGKRLNDGCFEGGNCLFAESCGHG